MPQERVVLDRLPRTAQGVRTMCPDTLAATSLSLQSCRGLSQETDLLGLQLSEHTVDQLPRHTKGLGRG